MVQLIIVPGTVVTVPSASSQGKKAPPALIQKLNHQLEKVTPNKERIDVIATMNDMRYLNYKYCQFKFHTNKRNRNLKKRDLAHKELNSSLYNHKSVTRLRYTTFIDNCYTEKKEEAL